VGGGGGWGGERVAVVWGVKWERGEDGFNRRLGVGVGEGDVGWGVAGWGVAVGMGRGVRHGGFGQVATAAARATAAAATVEAVGAAAIEILQPVVDLERRLVEFESQVCGSRLQYSTYRPLDLGGGGGEWGEWGLGAGGVRSVWPLCGGGVVEGGKWGDPQTGNRDPEAFRLDLDSLFVDLESRLVGVGVYISIYIYIYV
jgi:hypothetical protein